MRIRKRQVPFPLSSFCPVPLSDPHLINRSPVVQLNDPTPPKSSTPLLLHQATGLPPSHFDHPQPSDWPLLPPIGKPADAWGSSAVATESGAHEQHNKQDCLDEDGRGQEAGGEKGNDTRKGGILGSDTAAEVLPPSSPSNQDGRWCEGEKAIPLKKRRGSFERRVGDDMTENNTNNKKMKTRLKTKMNKKCSTQNDNEDEEEEEEETKAAGNVSKKRARGSALMEGSRCSRVNGRGWRCCQQTLVGYSLCEHHLGKGRLRSMTSVRNRSIATSAPKKNEHDPLSGASSSSHDLEAKDEKKPLMITKKRMKLGMVKARSISSLLGQTNTQNTVAENNK